jgi:hypothetical protein
LGEKLIRLSFEDIETAPQVSVAVSKIPTYQVGGAVFEDATK